MSVLMLEEPVGQLFPSQQMSEALNPTSFKIRRGIYFLLPSAGRHWHLHCGMVDHPGVTSRSHPKVQYFADVLNCLLGRDAAAHRAAVGRKPLLTMQGREARGSGAHSDLDPLEGSSHLSICFSKKSVLPSLLLKTRNQIKYSSQGGWRYG